MQSKAATVEQYLDELPADRRSAIERVRGLVLKHLDPVIAEGMTYGMIGYFIPHSVFAAGYHCDPKMPLPFAGLASQKNYMSLYLCSMYGEGDHWNGFREAWAKTGKKLDMGKCCIRFKRVEDLAEEVIADAIKRTTAAKYIARYQELLAAPRPSREEREAAAKKADKASKAAPKKGESASVLKSGRPPAAKSTKIAAKPAKAVVSKGTNAGAKKKAGKKKTAAGR